MSLAVLKSNKCFDALYTNAYVERQLEKFRNRHNNHWRAHLDLAERLASNYAPPAPARVLDLGCSIGTFAIEFAMKGYDALGLDLDKKSLEIAEGLAKEVGCSPEWVHADAANFVLKQQVDFAVCFDLFEHLSDDQIKKMLMCLKGVLRNDGVFIFHTFPTKYDHLFYKNNVFCLPLLFFRSCDHKTFERVVRIYARLVDCYYVLTRGKTWNRIIAGTVHPNPLTINKIEKLLSASGFEILNIETGLDSVNALKPGQGRVAKRFFSRQPVAHRSIWGVARKISD